MCSSRIAIKHFHHEIDMECLWENSIKASNKTEAIRTLNARTCSMFILYFAHATLCCGILNRIFSFTLNYNHAIIMWSHFVATTQSTQLWNRQLAVKKRELNEYHVIEIHFLPVQIDFSFIDETAGYSSIESFRHFSIQFSSHGNADILSIYTNNFLIWNIFLHGVFTLWL